MSNRKYWCALSGSVLAALSVWSCGGSAPSGSTPPTILAPTPAPTAPTAAVGATSCSLGTGSRSAACAKGASRLLGAVKHAIDELVAEQPALFDTTEEAGPGTGQYRVLDAQAYLDGVVAKLTTAGYCAQLDPDDHRQERVQVKSDNAFSETFDVLTAAGYIRRGGSYLESCTPASFPVDRSDLPPLGSGCGAPYPPPISRMNCKVHLHSSDVTTLDSTPIVGHDAAYCAAAGFTDGRALCAVRPENSPERVACEAWRTGLARDTGRPGPTWTTVDGRFCTGKESGCENHPRNQYALLVHRPGRYVVCAQTGSCCTVEVEH
jgi:hypothetical protein